MKIISTSLLILISSILIAVANPKTQDPQVLLINAVIDGDIERVKALLAQGVNPQAQDGMALRVATSNTQIILSLAPTRYDPKIASAVALSMAGSANLIREMRMVIESGMADPKAENSLVLFLASGKGQIDVVKLLLDKGADPKAVNSRALVAAVNNGHIEIVKLLLEKGADPKAEDSLALKAALYHGHMEIAKLLLAAQDIENSNVASLDSPHAKLAKMYEEYKKVANLNSMTNFLPDLVQASYRGDIETVKSFLMKGADSKTDLLAFLLACLNGHTEIVKLLLKHGVDPKAKDSAALALAADGGCVEVIQLLLAEGADPRPQTFCPLRCAVTNGHVEAIKLLFDKGTDDEAKATVLCLAILQGNIEIVKLLLEKGADPKYSNSVSLVIASESGHIEIVKLLLEKGVDPKAVNSKALCEASEKGHTEIVKLLLAKGANPKVLKR